MDSAHQTLAQQLEAAIAALESQRATLGDAVVDTGTAPLRQRLLTLRTGQAAASPELRLRHVTILFVDVVGSTALGERLDGEDLVRLMSSALERFAAAVRAERGRVLRYTGDGLKALFGSDGSDEDAPQCAVRAGLAILRAARGCAAEFRESGASESFEVRVGIDTGDAALGAGIEADNTAMGDTVNIASRMEQTAPPGALQISHDTYVRVRGLFDVVKQTLLAAKGREQPVQTYLVQRARPRTFHVSGRGVEGIRSRMVGRDDELAQLLAAFDDVCRGRHARAFTIVGEAGLGKSRLLYELQQALELDPRERELLLGRALPKDLLQPYGLLRDVITRRLKIADDDSADRARRELRDGIVATFAGDDAVTEFDAELIGHLIGHLIGIDHSDSARMRGIVGDPRQLHARAFGAALRWLRRLQVASGSTVVLLLDDLHWADDGSLDFVRLLCTRLADVPLLIVSLARPELLERRPDWFEGPSAPSRIGVGPLDSRSSDHLAHELLQHIAAPPAALHAAITNRASGNPYYMEELVRAFIDEGAIETDAPLADGAQRWHLRADALHLDRIPGTLTGVLQARLNALAPRDRLALQQASIVGSVFWDRALAAIDDDAPRSLDALERKGLTLQQIDSAFADSREYVFGHQLMQQVTYDTVLKANRRGGHARVAEWLAGRIGERAGEFLAVTAEHFERAGDRPQAAHYFERAAVEARDRYANVAAIAHARRALSNVDESELPTRIRLLQEIATLCDATGLRNEQAAALDDMLALAERDGDARRQADAWFGRALLAERRGEFQDSIALAIRASDLAARAEAWVTGARAFGLWAVAATRLGDYTTAREKAGLAIEGAARSGDTLAEAQMLAIAGFVEHGDGNAARGVELEERAIAIARRDGNLRLQCLMHGNIGSSLIALGDQPGGLRHAQASLDLAREIGLRPPEGTALATLGRAHLNAGDTRTSRMHCSDAVQVLTEVGDRYSAAIALLTLTDALILEQDWPQAARTAEQACELCDAAELPAHRLAAFARIATMSLDQGDLAAALAQIEPVANGIASGVELGFSVDGLRPHWLCHRVLVAAGDPRADFYLDAAHSRLQSQAAQIDDPAMRARFLASEAHHREVLAAWSRRQERGSAQARNDETTTG